MSAVISHAIFNLRAVCQFDGDRDRKELLEASLQVVGLGLGLAWRAQPLVACCPLSVGVAAPAGRACWPLQVEAKPSQAGCAGLADIRLARP